MHYIIIYSIFVIHTDLILIRETYILYKYNRYFVMCPIIHIITLVLTDNAFKNEYTTINAIYRVEIPIGVQQILLK